MMKSEKLKRYLDNIIERGVKVDYWFMTKQTGSDFFLDLFIAQIVERYQLSDKTLSYGDFYSKQFKDNTAMSEKYPSQIGENTYRNTIIPEYLGLIYRNDNDYDSAEVTDAYKLISKYIKTYEDMEIYHDLVERQLEKLSFNILNINRGEEKYKNITIFAIMLLYKILYELYHHYGSSYLSYNEFILFVMRTKTYADWPSCLELIELSREEVDFNQSAYIDKIVNQQYVNDIRFDSFFNELSNIKYIKKTSFEFANDESVSYIKAVLNKFENSKYCEITDKYVMKEFLCSANYFDGFLDSNLDVNNINNLLSVDNLDEGVIEDIVDNKVKRRNPGRVRDINNTTSVEIIGFPDTFKENNSKNYAPTVRLYNFEKINERNIEKGNKAEELIMKFEKLRLAELGDIKLVEKVEHVSKTKGDGLGYDILSYDIINGNVVPIYIEVKGTTLDENSPFDITKNELEIAKIHGKNYKIYRVSSLGNGVAKCFIIDGEELFKKLDFEAITFKAFKKESDKKE